MMLGLVNIYILFSFNYILIECYHNYSHNVADLSVQKLDRKLIERKRKDTLEMCRIFNSETKKEAILHNVKIIPSQRFDKKKVPKVVKKNLPSNAFDAKMRLEKKKIYRRSKREVNVNPALKVEDEQRVEKIVDRLYDDLLEKGQNVEYRRKQMAKTNEINSIIIANQTGRRFRFAPSIILPPTSSNSSGGGPADADINSHPPRFRHGIVPYFIDSKTYDSQLSESIMKAFDYVERATCIRLQRLRERPTDTQSLRNVIWLYITNPSGIRQCVHSNDLMELKGVQLIVFGYDCMSLGDIVHEIMHVLGFAHEHLRPDRDQYITIIWDNIKPGYRKYFEFHPHMETRNLPYDYASVLHYPPRAFSRNGQVTILTEPGVKVGQREGLSEIDVEKIGSLYSNECIKRNREYLLKTCPSVVKSDLTPKQISQQEIEDYFEDRLWSYGIVNYKLRDKMEFTTEEIENIHSVIRHIEKETCIEFRDLTESDNIKETETSESKEELTEKDRFVQLESNENGTNAQLPNLETSTSEEEVKMNEIMVLDEQTDKGAKREKEEKNDIVAKPKKEEKNDIVAKPEKEEKNDIVAKPEKEEKNETETGKKPGSRKKREAPPTPQRRHATNVLVLARSPMPGCSCPIPGQPKGLYTLKINADCFNSVNDLLHVFVHVLGLDHQHNMHDRDSYLHIVWDQLSQDLRKEMERKLPAAASVGFAYDYQSVMHYPWLQIKNGRTNIMYPIWNDGWAMGHWQGLSATDVQKLNLLYFKQCIERKQQTEDAMNGDGRKLL